MNDDKLVEQLRMYAGLKTYAGWQTGAALAEAADRIEALKAAELRAAVLVEYVRDALHMAFDHGWDDVTMNNALAAMDAEREWRTMRNSA